MPLVRYEVRSEYGLANAELYQSVPEDDPEGLVEAVAMAGLVGIVRQLGDMAEFAAELFHQLHEEVMSTAARGHGVLARVQQLEAELPTFEKTLATQTKQLQFAYTQGTEFHAAIRDDQNHLTQGDLPRFVRNSYDECRAPPRLFLLDKFDMNGAGACLKRYTDPSFFKREWASSELFKAEKDIQDRKARRIKRKGFGHSTGETRNTVSMPQIRSRVPFSLLDMENLTSTSRNMENRTSTSRNMENRTSTSRNTENLTSTSRNMENLTSTSQDMENLASTSQDMENLTSTSHTTSEDLKPIYVSDMATVSSALNETSGKAPSVMREDTADEPQTDAHVIQAPWKADNMGFSDNSTVGEANVAPIDDVQSETDINDAGDQKAMEKNGQSEENGLQKVVELLEEQQQIPLEEEHDQTVEAMESEPEQFVDALGTMDSEVETDTESKSKVDAELFSDARDGEGSVKSSYSEWYSDAWEGEGSTRVTSGDLSADAKGEDSVISIHSALDSSVPSKHNFNVEKDLISIQPMMDDLEPLEMRGRNISSSPSSVTSSFSSAEDGRSVPPVHVQLEHKPSPPNNGDDFKSQMQAVSSLLDDLNDSASADHVSETLSSCSEHGDDFSSSFHLLPEPAIPLSNGSEPGKIRNLGALSSHRRESADLEKNGDDGPKSVLSETEEILSQTSLADSFDMPLPMQAESTDDDNGDDIDGDGIDMNDGDVTEGSDIDALEIVSKSSSSSPSMFSSPRVLAPIKNNRPLPSHSSIHSPFSSESSLRSFSVLKDLHSPRPSVKLGGDGFVPSSEDSEPEGIVHVQTDASNASSPLLESKLTLDESSIFEPTSLPTIKVVAEEHPIPKSSLGTEKSLKESPPLPPLPPLKWRVMKPRADAQSPSSAGSIKEDLASAMPSDSGTITSTPFMPFTARGSTMPPSSQPTETVQWRPAVHVVERTNSLVEAIPSHDRNVLRKAASQNHLPRPKPSDERVSLLEQIRAKSFSLRHTVIEKHGAPPPVTSINVAAILEKANAIRQAFAGSDDDEDDDDDWNDN